MRWQRKAQPSASEATQRAANPCVAAARRVVAEQRKCTPATCDGNERMRKSRHSKGKAILSYAVARHSVDMMSNGKARRLPAMA